MIYIISATYLFATLVNYILIRDMILSIVWCDTMGKQSRLKQRLKAIPLYQRIRMTGLQIYIQKYKKEFSFWLKVKDFYVVGNILAVVAFVVCVLINQAVSDIVIGGMALLAVGYFIFHGFFLDFNKRTKYDRIRLAHKNKKN